MKSLKKIVAGLALPAVMAVTGLSSVAHAQTVAVRRNNFDPISQWIVLDGLFGNSGVFGGNGGVVSGPNGTIVSNGGYGGGVFNDPISQWIVLDALFGNNGVFDGNGLGNNGALYYNN